MKQHDYEKNGYEIKNAKITNVSLNFKNHGCLTFDLCVEGNGWGTVFGGYCLGNGYLNADEFEGSAKGLEAIMRIMDVVGVEDIMDLNGKYVRIPILSGKSIHAIGNIIKDKWFDYKEFYKNED